MQWIEKGKFYVKSVTRKGVDLMQTPFKLTEDLVFDDVVVTLATDLARVEGQVMLPHGELLADLTVIVAAADDVTRRFSSGSRTLQAGAKGKIVFDSAPGEYLIAALPSAEYEKIQSEISNEYFEKNAEKFLRIKVCAAETIKALAIPMMGVRRE